MMGNFVRNLAKPFFGLFSQDPDTSNDRPIFEEGAPLLLQTSEGSVVKAPFNVTKVLDCFICAEAADDVLTENLPTGETVYPVMIREEALLPLIKWCEMREEMEKAESAEEAAEKEGWFWEKLSTLEVTRLFLTAANSATEGPVVTVARQVFKERININSIEEFLIETAGVNPNDLSAIKPSVKEKIDELFAEAKRREKLMEQWKREKEMETAAREQDPTIPSFAEEITKL